MELEACRAMTLFISDAVGLILTEHGNYNEIYPVPYGAEVCLTSLSDKIHQLSMRG